MFCMCAQIVLFLVHIKLKLGGKVGPFTLEYLMLDELLEPVGVDTSVRQKMWFGILT